MSESTMSMAELAAMELHTTKQISNTVSVMRVFNGWIYTTVTYASSGRVDFVSTVFVPKVSS